MKNFEFFLEKKNSGVQKSFEEKGVYHLSKLMMEENLFMNAKSLRLQEQEKTCASESI